MSLFNTDFSNFTRYAGKSDHIWCSGRFEKMESNPLRRETSLADLKHAESPKIGGQLRRVKSDSSLATPVIAVEWPAVYKRGPRLGTGAYAEVSQVDLSSPASLSYSEEDGDLDLWLAQAESPDADPIVVPEIVVGSPSQRRLWASEATPRRHSSYISGQTPRTPRTPSPRSMAFKQFRRDADDPVDSDFSLEVQILASLNHQQIPKVYQTFTDGFFIELIQGPTLTQFLEKKRKNQLSELEARPLLRQLVELVHYIHRNGVIHRDLKPDNLKIKEKYGLGGSRGCDYTVHLIDFGFACFYQTEMDQPDKMLDDRCGTMEYMAPELLESKSYYGPETDIWSLGCLIYEVVQGRTPFYGGIAKIYSGVLDYVRNADTFGGHEFSYLSPVSNQFKMLVRTCLAPRADNRRHVAKILDHPWWTAMGDELQPEEMPATPKPIRRRSGLRTIKESSLEV